MMIQSHHKALCLIFLQESDNEDDKEDDEELLSNRNKAQFEENKLKAWKSRVQMPSSRKAKRGRSSKRKQKFNIEKM